MEKLLPGVDPSGVILCLDEEHVNKVTRVLPVKTLLVLNNGCLEKLFEILKYRVFHIKGPKVIAFCSKNKVL